MSKLQSEVKGLEVSVTSLQNSVEGMHGLVTKLEQKLEAHLPHCPRNILSSSIGHNNGKGSIDPPFQPPLAPIPQVGVVGVHILHTKDKKTLTFLGLKAIEISRPFPMILRTTTTTLIA